MVLPAIGAALAMAGRVALTGIGGALRLSLGASRSVGARAARGLTKTSRAAKRGRGRRRRRTRSSQSVARGFIKQKNSWLPQRRRRAAQALLKLRRYEKFKRLRDALPSNAPASVTRSVRQRLARAQGSLDRFADRQGEGASMQEGFSQMSQAMSNATKGVIGLGVASYAAGRGLETVGRSVAQYSGAHAVSAAQLDVSRIHRTRRLGQQTGESFRRMTKSLDKIEEALLPFIAAGLNFMNDVIAWTNNFIADMITGLRTMLPAWMGGFGAGGPPPPPPPPLIDPILQAQRAFINNQIRGNLWMGGNIPPRPSKGPFSK